LTSGPQFTAGLTSGVSRIRCCVAKIKNIRHKRPNRKFKIPSSVIQWGIVGVVAVVLVVLVVGALSRPPAEPAPIPMLSTAKPDLISVTRMLGDVALDSSTRSLLPGEMNARFAGPDSLFAERRWYDALTALSKMLKGSTRPESAAIRAYMAFCDYEADNLDRSLQHFRKSLAADSNPTGIAPRTAFSIGWMFQSRGYQDSAVVYYSRARRILPDSSRLLRASAANNAGAAYEVLKDTSAAGGAYREAVALLDTIGYPRELKTIRENLSRLTNRIQKSEVR
jgi:tetratricopeptide (TPR) repeat protein